MADSSHLEKMGTELKCPICLSLLNSAVSLTCNHVFCNLCIQKSMKEASSCPVCKIPFRRREVRPAPHMDNLVSIYRSMELASGMNIFVTQTAPPAKLSGAENQVEDVMVHRGEEDGETCRGTKKAQNKRRYKNKMSGQLNNNSQDFNLHPLRPSFPTKKRIRVPQHTPPATPTVDRKLEDGKYQHSENGAQRSLPGGKALLSDKGEPNFTPFFWLRDEEDAERSSQHTDEENLMDTQIDAPCFSDIKDSSDVNPYNGTAKGEPHIQKEDIFDSEMFEWTQRACSPELCPSQIEEQVNESNGCNITEEFEDGILHDSTDGSSRVWHADALSLKQGTDNVAVILPKVTLPTLVSSQMKKSNHIVATERPKKRARKARGCIHEKRVRKDAVEIGGACTSTEKGAAYGIQENCNKNGELLNLEENINRDTEQMAIKKAKSTSSVGMKVFTSSDEGNTINERNATMVFGASDLSDVKGGKNKSKNVTIIGKNSEKTAAQRQIYGDVTLSKSGRQTRKSGCKNNNNSNPGKKSDFSKRVRFSTDDNSQFVAGIQSTHGKSVSKELQPFEKVLRNACAIVEKEPSEVKNAPSRSNAMLLQKCQAVSSIQCAFCLSTEEHNKQLSGPMVHYLKGKPVAAIHNKSSGVIHAHRNCAEWAPNVYFDDDTAINLDAELARSRRIKCSLCGLKGAALGCYEKSCRKSFHFPCAKSMQQCRWDNENFVMLCPLHATLKLPNETCGPLQKEKQNHVPKRPSQMPVSQINKDGKSATPRWNSHVLFSKMVLCCSALTSMEKGTISEFEKLSGVAVVKTWDPRVTHVIASTDENGACRRTLKFLMGILEGKWILSIEWVNACMKIKDHVDEQQYEIGIDIHGIRDGARLGRMRLLNKQPKLFSGYSFYFTGDFVPSYKGYLHDLVVAAGGTVLHRKPISLDHEALSSGWINSKILVVYSLEIPDKCSPSKKNAILSHRKSDAETLAIPAGALAVSNLWILNSIVSYKLQTLPE